MTQPEKPEHAGKTGQPNQGGEGEPDAKPDSAAEQDAEAGQPAKDNPAQPQQEAATTGSGRKVDVAPDKMARFVTSIKEPAQQIGEHVVAALQHADTVAVLTTVVIGPGGQQHIVSAALDPQQVSKINALLQGAEEQREEEEPCVGFHCLIKPKKESRG